MRECTQNEESDGRHVLEEITSDRSCGNNRCDYNHINAPAHEPLQERDRDRDRNREWDRHMRTLTMGIHMHCVYMLHILRIHLLRTQRAPGYINYAPSLCVPMFGECFRDALRRRRRRRLFDWTSGNRCRVWYGIVQAIVVYIFRLYVTSARAKLSVEHRNCAHTTLNSDSSQPLSTQEALWHLACCWC